MSWVKEVVSRVRERILVMCVPRLRWMPLHSMQTIMPRLMLTHSTRESELQSAHQALPASASRMDWRRRAGLSSLDRERARGGRPPPSVAWRPTFLALR